MPKETQSPKPQTQTTPSSKPPPAERPLIPLPNYSLSTVCPACGSDTFRLACKVRCPKCGFTWDCSEL